MNQSGRVFLFIFFVFGGIVPSNAQITITGDYANYGVTFLNSTQYYALASFNQVTVPDAPFTQSLSYPYYPGGGLEGATITANSTPSSSGITGSMLLASSDPYWEGFVMEQEYTFSVLEPMAVNFNYSWYGDNPNENVVEVLNSSNQIIAGGSFQYLGGPLETIPGEETFTLQPGTDYTLLSESLSSLYGDTDSLNYSLTAAPEPSETLPLASALLAVCVLARTKKSPIAQGDGGQAQPRCQDFFPAFLP